MYSSIEMDKLETAKILVDDVMTRSLITVTVGSSVEEAVKKMIEYDVECLPVIDSEGILHGLITFRDIVTKAVLSQVNIQQLKVEDIMTKNPITCSPTSTVLEVVKIMKNKHLRRVPVVDSSNRLLGLITDFDLALLGWEVK
jgi:CBS domain-containing protein